MEDVLSVYERPYNAGLPVVCMDEQPVQLIKETKNPIPMSPGRVAYYDYEYERLGSTNIFMFTEPLAGWRRASVSERKTSQDWAREIKKLVDEDYKDNEKIILVCDNLSTHKIGSLYDAFPPEEAQRIANKLEIHFTPKHGSWLNIAEIELSAMTRQCLDRRIETQKELDKQIQAWAADRNESQTGVNWQFTDKNARTKLRSLYPEIESQN